MRIRTSSLAVLCLAVSVAAVSRASILDGTSATGAITGVVTYAQGGGAVAGATVTAANNDGASLFTATTDGSGAYSLSVKPGNYTVSASAGGCGNVSPAVIGVVNSGGALTANFSMDGAAGLAIGSFTLDDASGNGNGVVDPNECFRVSLQLVNSGCSPATGISVSIGTGAAGVSVPTGAVATADAAAGQSVSTGALPLSTEPTFGCGTPIDLLVSVSSSGGIAIGHVVLPTCASGSLAEGGRPSAPAAASSGPVCAGATLGLSASTVPGATYAWSGPGGFTSFSQNPVLSGVTTAASGTYTVRATVNGCTSPAGSVNVSVNPDAAPPSVTAPAPLVVQQTQCCGVFGGASAAASPDLAAFLGSGTAVDDCDPSPARLAAQATGKDITSATCFEAGTTEVAFRFQDTAGRTGTAASSVTVEMFGDVNLDGIVDPTDMVILRAYFNFAVTPGTPPFTAPLGLGDLNHDGNVDPTDLVMLRAYFNFAVACLAP